MCVYLFLRCNTYKDISLKAEHSKTINRNRGTASYLWSVLEGNLNRPEVSETLTFYLKPVFPKVTDPGIAKIFSTLPNFIEMSRERMLKLNPFSNREI